MTTIFEAVAALRQGLVIAYPTETLFGLGVDPFNGEAVERLLALKGRQANKGLILLVPVPSWVARLATPSPTARRLMDQFWPGPLTLVLPASQQAPAWVTGENRHVALRLSPNPTVIHLLAQWQAPLVSTSANIAGGPDLKNDQGVREQWQDQVAVVLPGSSGAAPSTVLQVNGEQVTVLREGGISGDAIFKFLDQEPVSTCF